MPTISPTQSDYLTVLRSFLLTVLPDGIEVVAGVVNRVPEPRSPLFVVMTPIRFMRLRTNLDSASDVRFIGSVAANLLTVSDVSFGTILAGATLFGVGVVPNTRILTQASGTPGGVGTYTLTGNGGSIGPGNVLSSGAQALEQGAEVTVQLDFHSADNTAGDMAQTVSTTLRDAYGAAQFASQGLEVFPLYADDPRYMPFINENQQYEWRWVLEARLQVNQIVAIPLQYADSLDVTLISVDATYAP